MGTPESLTLRLRVTNVGEAAFSFNALLHTYFKIPDVANVTVRGLRGLSYVDKTAGNATKTQDDEVLSVPAFTDSVFKGATCGPALVTVGQKNGFVLCSLSNVADMCRGSAQCPDVPKPCDVVVWNPYDGASPGDLPVPSFKEFVCVEPGLVSSMHDLPPMRSAELSQVITPA